MNSGQTCDIENSLSHGLMNGKKTLTENSVTQSKYLTQQLELLWSTEIMSLQPSSTSLLGQGIDR